MNRVSQISQFCVRRVQVFHFHWSLKRNKQGSEEGITFDLLASVKIKYLEPQRQRSTCCDLSCELAWTTHCKHRTLSKTFWLILGSFKNSPLFGIATVRRTVGKIFWLHNLCYSDYSSKLKKWNLRKKTPDHTITLFYSAFMKSRTTNHMLERGKLSEVPTDNLIVFEELLGKVQRCN